MSSRFSWLIVLFNCFVSLLTFSLVVLSITDSMSWGGQLLFFNCLSVYPFKSGNFCFMYYVVLFFRCKNIYSCYVFLLNLHSTHYKLSLFVSSNIFFGLELTLSNISIDTPNLFWSPFTWCIFSILLLSTDLCL